MLPENQTNQFETMADQAAAAELERQEANRRVHSLLVAQKLAYTDRTAAVEPVGQFIASVRIGVLEWRLGRATAHRDQLER